MADPILHHYDISPYSEKIRLVMGLKGLAWKSVRIPITMPKPDLTALTGGYRLTPVLQIGADLYCDTRTIAAALEALRPEPTLYPEGQAARTRGLCAWAETMFRDLIVLFLGLGDFFPQEFVEDRKKMVPGGFEPAAARPLVASKRDQLRAKLDVLERQLAGGMRWLIGEAPSLADFAAYHPMWALRTHPELARMLDPFPCLHEWMERVAAVGHGTRTEITSTDALELARAATPTTATVEDPGDPNGRKPGDRVRVVPEEYGLCPVEGELVASDAHRIALRRHDERVGDVVVHFPKEGFLSFPAG